MAPTKAAPKPAAPATAKTTKKPVVKRGKPRNYDLGTGVYRFSRTKMFHKTAKYKFIGKRNQKVEKVKKPTTIEKPVGGEKNGGKRIVLIKKRKNFYPTAKKINSHPSKRRFSSHTRYTRASLQPGTVLILLAGRHKGKRVVLLKVLKSGLLLVTGPYKINGCPLRRISQNYVIATRTRLDVSGLKLEELTDDQMKRTKAKRGKKEEGDIFTVKKEGYKMSDERKERQKTVDAGLLAVIKKHPDRSVLVKYLKAMFGLKKTQFPHRLKF